MTKKIFTNSGVEIRKIKEIKKIFFKEKQKKELKQLKKIF